MEEPNLRDYYAVKAMQVVMQKSWKRYLPLWDRIKMMFERKDYTKINHYHFVSWKYVAETSFEIADRMMKERNKPTNPCHKTK